MSLLVYLFLNKAPKDYVSNGLVYTNAAVAKGISASGEATRVDYYTSNNLFDNLVFLIRSRQTIEEASLHLLALHLSLPKSNPRIISEETYNEIKDHISPELWVKLGVRNNEEQTYLNILDYLDKNINTPVEYLLKDHPNYGVSNIQSRLTVNRKAASDMIELNYRSNDPGVTQHTLKRIIDAFMNRYKGLRESENSSSIRYFEDQLKLAADKLKVSESDIKSFISANRILNFYEQGKYLDIAKLEQDQDEERAKRLSSGTAANLQQVESLFDVFSKRGKQIDEVITIQKTIQTKTQELNGLQLNPTSSPAQLAKLQQELKELNLLADNVTSAIYQSSNTQEGVARKTMLDEWLKLKLQHEEQIQALDVMKNRKELISDKIAAFAPLGAELKKLEREVSISENQYLSILQGLNQAYLQKYDLETSSSQSVIDEPNFPGKPQSSRKMVLIAGTSFVGFILTLGFLLGLYFIDPTIRNAERASARTQLSLLSAFPNLKRKSWWVHYPSIIEFQTRKIISEIELVRYQNSDKNTQGINILVCSTQKGEGKSFLISKLVQALNAEGKFVHVIGWKNDILLTDRLLERV
ncbi:MAG: lipopolysaccharide biosynthesis protein [Saprospiraceae bacterium]|nr:lipopolysaccharide biosynthesis protein [Saprospiraceae bacterium]